MYYSLTSPRVAELLAVARVILTEVISEQIGLLADLRDGSRGRAPIGELADAGVAGHPVSRGRPGTGRLPRLPSTSGVVMLALWRKIRATGRVAEPAPPPPPAAQVPRAGRELGGSVQIRHVDAGSCNGCEVEIGAAFGPVYDADRYGARLVASPRHADALLVTGVGHPQHGRATAPHLRGGAGPETRCRRRRLRPQLRRVRGGAAVSPGRCATSSRSTWRSPAARPDRRRSSTALRKLTGR